MRRYPEICKGWRLKTGKKSLNVMRFALLFVLTWQAAVLGAQTLSSISTRWNDSFVEWEIYAVTPRDTTREETDEDSEEPDESLLGELKLRWLNVRED